MSRYSTNLKDFLNYLGKKDLYFGRKYITSLGFITMYLNYNTEHNFLRQYVLKHTKFSNEELNTSVMHAISISDESETTMRVNEIEELDNIPLSLELTLLVANGLSAIEFDDEDPFVSLSKFIYYVFLDEQSTTFTKEFEVVFGLKLPKSNNIFVQNMVLNKEPERRELDIPEDIRKYVSIIDGKSEEYNFKKIEDLSNKIWENFQKRKRNVVAIFGNISIGKKNIVQKLAYDIAHDKEPERFENSLVIKVDLFKMVGDVTGDNSAQAILKKVFKFLNGQKDLIVFLDHFYTVEEYDGILEGITSFYTTSNFKLITTVPLDLLENYVKEEKISKSSIMIVLQDPKKEGMEEKFAPTLYSLAFYHGVIIPENLVETALLYTMALSNTSAPFADCKNLIDISMVRAKESGRYFVKIEDILASYKQIFDLYNKESETMKRNTAIHEAGHFVVSRFCKSYKANYVTFINILPGIDGTLGFNAFDFDFSKLEELDPEYYKEAVAVYLGGRAAEKIFAGVTSAGAQSDYEQASATVREVVANLDLNEEEEGKVKLNENLVYEASIERVDEDAQKILQDAYDLACDILNKHGDYLKALAKMLLDKKVVSTKEIKSYEVEKDGKIELDYPRKEKDTKKAKAKEENKKNKKTEKDKKE